MAYQCDLGGTRFRFPSLKTLLARATPERSGDHLAGVAAETPLERVAAQMALANVPLTDFLDDVLEVDGDGITALIFDQQDAQAFAPIRSLTVGGFRDWLLAPETTGAVLCDLAPGLTPEMVAATSKLMRVQDLIAVSRKIEIVTRFRSTIGLAGRLSTRNQPNHPTDDSQGIALSALDGLMIGAGDAVIGVNPAPDSVADFIRICDVLDVIRSELDVPTQTCWLGHVTTALDAMQADAPVDLVFQSIAGSDKANDGFGVTLEMLDDEHEAVRALGRAPDGANEDGSTDEVSGAGYFMGEYSGFEITIKSKGNKRGPMRSG